MNFVQQIKNEIKNIFRSKFLLIIGLLIIVTSIGIPVINKISEENNDSPYGYAVPVGGMVYEEVMYASEMAYYGGGSGIGDSITVNGVTITDENPFFWNIQSLNEEKGYLEKENFGFSSPEVTDLVLEMMDAEIDHYLRFAQIVTSGQDYRTDLAWSSSEYIYNKFIYEHTDVDEDILYEAIQFRKYYEVSIFQEKFIDITPEERLKALDETDEHISLIYQTAESNDFPKYVELRIDQQKESIETIEEQIALHEQTIIDNPAQEEHLSMIIEDLQKQITNTETNTIPMWEYRLENNIIPGDGSWQNSALNIERYQQQVLYTTILTEEEFNQERYMVEQYGSYAKYKQQQQATLDEANNNILIAQHSLDAGMPDMKFVQDGARNKTVGFLSYSIFIALFAVLVGGWFIAREFSQGTIRLLMIRPKTRTKILMSKFLAALLICLAMYLAGCILNLVTNGALFGFADLGYPNFTASGEMGFFAYYLPKFLACSVSIILAYTVAFMLSAVTKNIAVSIAVPVVCFIATFIGMQIIAYSRLMPWIAYTPIPYVQVSSFFTQWSPVNTLIERGAPISLTYGILLLLGISAICTLVAIRVFKKRDITN